MKKLTISLMVVFALAGCGTDPVKITKTTTKANGDKVVTVTAPSSTYGDQLDATVALNSRPRQPLCRMKASGTTPITGVEVFECYAPEDPIALPAAPQSTAAAITHDVVSGVVTLGTYGIAGSAIKSVAGSIERAGTAGYEFIQPPSVPAPAPANITNNIGGDAVQGNGSTLNSNSGTGAAGGNFTDTHPTSTDSHAVDDHASTTTNNAAPVVP